MAEGGVGYQNEEVVMALCPSAEPINGYRIFTLHVEFRSTCLGS